MQPHRGTMILIFGILGLVVCMPFGIVAWIMGSGDLKAMDAGRMDPEGRGITEAGKIIGIIATSIFTVGLLFGLLMMIIALALPAVASANSLII
jgi:hypothetical protein